MMTMSSVASQQQEQQVPPISKSGRHHQLDTDSSASRPGAASPGGGCRAPAGKQLSVVLPGQANAAGPHKSLVTPTIVTSASGDQASGSPGHLFGSLAVQLSGQEVGLFTGLPSCTPTSADGLAAAAANLTGINPFFWGVGPHHQAPGAQQSEQEEQRAGEAAGAAADGKRRQLGKLQLDQLQQSAMMLSPFSFLLSPEQEAWLRLGQQQQQQPLATTGAVEPQQQQPQAEAAPSSLRLTAQDLTSHQPPAAQVQARAGYNSQISTSNSCQPARCNTLNLQLQRPPQPEVRATSGPPVAHFSQANPFGPQPATLAKGGEFCHHHHQQQQTANAPGLASLNPASQPSPMIATLHYDGLHYDPHLQQLYLAQQQQQHQDMYHHQQAYYGPQVAAIVTPAPTPTATATATTYQPQTYATTQDPPAPVAERIKPAAPVIVMEASSSPHHQFNITSASNSSARSSVSRDTTINVEISAAQNGSKTVKAAPKSATNGQANELTPDAVTEVVVVKKKSKGGRKKKQVTHEELMARKNRSKERNRVAAKRCRQKRKQFLDELRDRIDNLSDSNKRVLKENTMLKSELELLRKHHKTCRIIS